MNWRKLWPAAELKALRESYATLERERNSLATGLKNATMQAGSLQERLNEANAKECPTCVELKKVINYLTFAAGSRMKIFDEVGPELPKPREIDLSKLNQQQGPQRAAVAVRQRNEAFLKGLPELMAQKDAEFASWMEAKIKESSDSSPA